MVLGIEMSRLARSCRDWHQLLETCALFETLIADVDGVYDPRSYNDRLLLGLKGTMSEAELHILKARMLEGKRAKARRGELVMPVPMGYIVNSSSEIVLDPDEQAQTTIRMIFTLFERFRTLGKVLKYLVENGIQLPVRSRLRPNRGELEWHRPLRISVFNILRNPIYAGAYTYGITTPNRRGQKRGRHGNGRCKLRAEEAEVLLHDRVPAYITWSEYQRNLTQLEANKSSNAGAVRAGQALLSGVVACGRCGRRMSAVYNNNGHIVRYVCLREKAHHAGPSCQTLVGPPLDRLVADLILQALKPAALEVSLRAAADLEAERSALDRQWRQRVERAQTAAHRVRRQYDAVEPENRLVARTLERAWEEALAEQARLEDEYARFKQHQPPHLTEPEIAAINALATDLPALWHAPTTTRAERQIIVRLLLERVVVEVKGESEQVRVDCHWTGGHKTSHRMVRPVARLDQLSTYDALVDRVTALHGEGLSNVEIAKILNSEGWRPARRADAFSGPSISNLLVKIGLTARSTRPLSRKVNRQPNEWTVKELAAHLDMPASSLYTWIRKGHLKFRPVSGTAEGRKLLHADEADIAALVALRTNPPPWCGVPVDAISQP